MPIPAGETAPENKEISNPLADAFEANAGDKPKIDYANKVNGYPTETLEITESDVAAYQKYLPELREEMRKQIKGREPRHGDVIGTTIDKYPYFLLIDDNANPKERMFRAKEKTADAGEKTEADEIPAEKLKQLSKGYPEINNAPKDVVQTALKTFKDSQGRDMKNEETAIAYDTRDFEYVVLRDDTRTENPYRVFKSPEPVPA